MVFGDTADFGIETEILELSGDWVFGRVVFLVEGELVGNPQDAADMRGCRNWMKDYLSRLDTPVDDALASMSPAAFFEIVFDPVMARGNLSQARYPRAFAQFSISHLGMSSFDRYDLLLLPLAGGGHRLLWREANTAPRSHDIAPGRFRTSIEQCAAWLDSALPAPAHGR